MRNWTPWTRKGPSAKWSRRWSRPGKVDADEFESIVKAILKREELGSTGIGRGVAVPHTKHPSVDRLVGTVAVSPTGVDFASLDGEMVHLFFLLISPPDRPGDHLRALGKHLAATSRRHLLPLPQAGQDARRTSSNCWTKPTTTSSDRDADAAGTPHLRARPCPRLPSTEP